MLKTKFLEYARFFNNYYGTPKKAIYDNFKKGKIIYTRHRLAGK